MGSLLRTARSVKGYGISLNGVAHPGNMDHCTIIRAMDRVSDTQYKVITLEARSHATGSNHTAISTNLGRLLIPYKIYGIKYLTI